MNLRADAIGKSGGQTDGIDRNDDQGGLILVLDRHGSGEQRIVNLGGGFDSISVAAQSHGFFGRNVCFGGACLPVAGSRLRVRERCYRDE